MFQNLKSAINKNKRRFDDAFFKHTGLTEAEINAKQTITESTLNTLRVIDLPGVVSQKIHSVKLSFELINDNVKAINKSLVEDVPQRYEIDSFFNLDLGNPITRLAKLIHYVPRNPTTGNFIVEAFSTNPARINVDGKIIDLMFRYLMDPNFEKVGAAHPIRDAIYYAVIVVLSRFSNSSYEILLNKPWSNDSGSICKFIKIIQDVSDNMILTLVGDSTLVPFGSFKYLEKAKQPDSPTLVAPKMLSSFIKPEWFNEMQEWVQVLKSNPKNTPDSKFAGKKDPMVNAPNVDLSKLAPIPVVYVTGTACVGKSSALDSFKTISRGELGGFDMKCVAPEQAASLNAAVNELSTTDYVGDRGTIDNVLWTFIMSNINTDPDELLDQFIIWIDNTFNEISLARFVRELVLVIVDSNSGMNRIRMLKRASGGDLDRGRIISYPFVQSFAYYAFARLVGWEIVQVAYLNGIWLPGFTDANEKLKKFMEFKREYNEALGPIIKKFKPNYEEQEYKLPANPPATYSLLSYADAKAFNIYK